MGRNMNENTDQSNVSRIVCIPDRANQKLQGVPKNRTNKTNKNGQTWQACQHFKVV